MLVALLALPLSARGATVVAVLDIKDETGRFEPATLAQWSWSLRARVVEGGDVQLLPPAEAEAELNHLLADAQRPSIDDAARLEPGRRAAAQLLIEPRLLAADGRCVLVGPVYDVERGATVRVAVRKSACTSSDLSLAAEGLGQAIAGREELQAEIEASEPDTPAPPIALGWFTLGAGYATTLGGAAGPALEAQLFTFKGPWWSFTVADVGMTLGAHRATRGLDFGTGHDIHFAGTTLGAHFDLGPASLSAAAGPALFASTPDDFFGTPKDGDSTGGLVPAALLALRVQAPIVDAAVGNLVAVGAVVRAIVPAVVERGAPQVLMAALTISLGP